MIYTCTFNPCIDYYLNVDELGFDDVIRSNNESFLIGGKGINVSIVLSRLETKNIAFGYIAGFTGAYLKEQLKNMDVQTDFIEIDGITRINVKIHSNQNLDISANGPTLNESNFKQLRDKIETLSTDDWLVLSGSVLSGISDDTYKIISEICFDKGIKLIVDSTNNHLLQTLENNPFLIKPNHHELGEIFNVKISDIDSVIKYGKELLKMGPQNVIVSRGGDGAVFINKDIVLECPPLKGIVKNTVGCGDSMVAGFVSKFVETNDYLESFRYACACGSATAFSEGLLHKNEVEALLSKLIVNRI